MSNESTNVSTEGFFDSIRNLFSKKETVDGKYPPIYGEKDRRSLMELIDRTFANKNWVTRNHLKVRDLTLSVEYTRALSGTGKFLTPTEAMDESKALFVAMESKYNNGDKIAKYVKQLKVDTTHLERFYQSGKTTTEQMLHEMRRRIANNRPPNDLTKKREYKVVYENRRLSGDKKETISTLTADEVVTVAKHLLQTLRFIDDYDSANPWLYQYGTDMSSDVWNDYTDVYDSEVIRTSDEFDHFYHQGIPEKIVSDVANYLYFLGTFVLINIYVLSQSVRINTTNFSIESVDRLTSLITLRDKVKRLNGVNVSVALECLRLEPKLPLPNYLEYSNRLSDKYLDVTLECLDRVIENMHQ